MLALDNATSKRIYSNLYVNDRKVRFFARLWMHSQPATTIHCVRDETTDAPRARNIENV